MSLFIGFFLGTDRFIRLLFFWFLFCFSFMCHWLRCTRGIVCWRAKPNRILCFFVAHPVVGGELATFYLNLRVPALQWISLRKTIKKRQFFSQTEPYLIASVLNKKSNHGPTPSASIKFKIYLFICSFMCAFPYWVLLRQRPVNTVINIRNYSCGQKICARACQSSGFFIALLVIYVFHCKS